MDKDQRRELMENNPPVVDEVMDCTLYFRWGWTGCGFGELFVKLDPESGEIHCANEFMGRESVRKMLHSLADHIADKMILGDEPSGK